MGKLEELGWIGLALGAQRAGHARGEELANYAAELDWIEEEIWRIRQDLLERYYELISGFEEPESARGLVLKKFLVALADEDVCSRLYAYGEKAYQLLNITFLIGGREDRPLRKQVIGWLERKEGAIASRMKGFSPPDATDASLIGDALQRRKLFTHRLAPKTELAILGRGYRLFESAQLDWMEGTLPGKDAADIAKMTFEIDHQCEEVRDWIEHILLELAEFGTALRGEVCHAMVRRGLMVRRGPMEDEP